MKIEKISDSRVKFILTREDFLERELDFAELAYSSEKAQRLFKDMLELASKETGFVADTSALIIEAVPISVDSLMVIVSKADSETGDHNFPLTDLFNRITKTDKAPSYGSPNLPAHKPAINRRNISIYSFDSLDDASLASSRLNSLFKGASSLHKYNSKYFICLQLPAATAILKMSELENILNEYGTKHVSNSLSRGFLLEHGELIINSNAICKLASI